MSPTAVAERATEARYELIEIELLFESPLNPRKTFNDVKLQELAASIREKGIIEPVIVREGETKKGAVVFEIIAGARRYRAAKQVGLGQLPTIVREYTDAQAVEIMAIENGQRDDVPPLEEAAGYKQLLGLDKGYTAAMIAQRIGHTEKFVWDRLKLLELIPVVRDLLAMGRIGVEHAEIIAKLKPEEQKRVAGLQNGGLFEHDGALEFDAPKLGTTAHDKVKTVSVRQLRQWIARHIRFDVQQAAAAAPLDFGLAAQRVEEAEAQPGRGKKVVPITFEHMCPQGAKAEERTYGASAWKKAEGKDGQPTCDHAVLGVVAAGPHYGEAFLVCITRDKCTVHWKAEVAHREKNEKLRASGKGKQAAKNEQREEQSWEKEQKRREAEEAAWKHLQPHAVAAVVAKIKPSKLTDKVLGDVIL